ncbi:transposase [Phyllobacterium sp. LjRoot231]
MVKYDENFKRQIVERYLTGKAGFKALAKEFGLHRALIQRWVALVHRSFFNGLEVGLLDRNQSDPSHAVQT